MTSLFETAVRTPSRPLAVALALAATACGAPTTSDDGGADAARMDGESPDAAVIDAPVADAPVIDAPDDPAPDDGACTPPDAGVLDLTGFTMAPQPPLPQVPDRGGRRIAHVQLATVTFANDPNRDLEESFAQWAPGSSWLRTVGAEYGIGAGTFLGAARMPNAAATMVNKADLEAMLATGIAAGTIPRPTTGTLDDALYVIYYPRTSRVLSDTGVSCQDWRAFHDETVIEGHHVAYAVVADCGGDGGHATTSDMLQVSSSHEILEAVTDPQDTTGPGWKLYESGPDELPIATFGHEIADICFPFRYVHQDCFLVQRTWSNAAAAAGGDPCVPADPSTPDINTAVSPTGFVDAAPGETVTFTLQGWSSAPVGNWFLIPRADLTGWHGATHPTVALSTDRMSNGGTATLRVTVPSDAVVGDTQVFLVDSSFGGMSLWPDGYATLGVRVVTAPGGG